MRNTTIISLILTLIGLPACSDVPVQQGSSSQAIIGGQPEFGSDWVVSLTYPRPDTGKLRLCSASLVAPGVVLTAKHCVFIQGAGGDYSAVDVNSFTVSVGHDFTDPGSITFSTGVSEVHTTPGVYERADALNGDDLALLVLAEDAPVAHKSIGRQAPALGGEIFIAGFGDTNTKLGEKHSGLATITELGSGTFTSTGDTWTCVGDSGGPALDPTFDVLVGVTSIGPTGCPASDSIYTRLDTHINLIDGVLGPPACAEAEVCGDGLDNDCDGSVDNGCKLSAGGSSAGGSSGAGSGASSAGGVGGAGAAVPAGPGSSAGDDGGCSLATPGPAPGAPGGSPLWLVTLALVGAIVGRRRFTAPRRSARSPFSPGTS